MQSKYEHTLAGSAVGRIAWPRPQKLNPHGFDGAPHSDTVLRVGVDVGLLVVGEAAGFFVVTFGAGVGVAFGVGAKVGDALGDDETDEDEVEGDASTTLAAVGFDDVQPATPAATIRAATPDIDARSLNVCIGANLWAGCM
jgi:hypothetical protein